MGKNETCSTSCCPWGWLGKKFLGLSFGLWLVVLALVPHSARGLSWVIRSATGVWHTAAKVVQVDAPARAERRQQGQ